jgi:hypothetical protein
MTELTDLLDEPLAAQSLGDAGWEPLRDVDPRPWEDWYAHEGYRPNAAVIAFLRSMGGLVLRPLEHDDAEFASGRVRFDPASAATGERERISERAEQIGEHVWPIGEWYDTYILLLGASGAVYAEAPEYGVDLLGRDIVAALRLLLTSKGSIESIIPPGS